VFEKMNGIDWRNLQQAHGTASHVPEAIKGLVSEDERVRERSYWLLDNYVVLQSDLYEAALFVVPFLLEILSSEIEHGRDLVYDLLFEIGNGYAPPEVSCKGLNGETVSLGEACRDAVLEGLNIYLGEVKTVDSKARLKALELLASLNEIEDTIRIELEDILSKEENGAFRVELKRVVKEMVN
jgi:hypothetical protein